MKKFVSINNNEQHRNIIVFLVLARWRWYLRRELFLLVPRVNFFDPIAKSKRKILFMLEEIHFWRLEKRIKGYLNQISSSSRLYKKNYNTILMIKVKNNLYNTLYRNSEIISINSKNYSYIHFWINRSI